MHDYARSARVWLGIFLSEGINFLCLKVLGDGI